MAYYQMFLNDSDCVKAARPLTPEGIILHSVGCAQSRASVFIRQWNRPGCNVAPHAIIDGSGDIYQTLPFNLRGWHAGGRANNTHIGIEMCEPSTLRYVNGYKFTVNAEDLPAALKLAERTYDAAVMLCRDLCVQYKLDPKSIISHAEAHALGIASDHGDPDYYWHCLGTSYTMNGFRENVRSALDAGKEWKVEITSVLTKTDADQIVSSLLASGYDALAYPVL